MNKTFKPATNRIVNYYGGVVMLPTDCIAIAADCTGEVNAFETMPEFSEKDKWWECPAGEIHYLGAFDEPLTVEEARTTLWIANEFYYKGFELAKNIKQPDEGITITINGFKITVPNNVVYIAVDGDGLVHAFTDCNVALYACDVTWRPEDDDFKMLLGKCDTPTSDMVCNSLETVVSN